MMKKNGFTLAEVLITLAIIGVVATLTLPALMTNTQEQQARTAIKKGINTLTEAAQMNNAIAGFDYASFTTTTNSDEAQSILGLLRNRTTIDFQTSGTADGTDGSDKNVVAGGAGNYVVFFRDGSALQFDLSKTLHTATSGSLQNSRQQTDGLPYGITAIYDTNGKKGPNLLSNCRGNASMTAKTAVSDNTTNQCLSKTNRVIKDQFGVRLRGSYAVPNGEAARWAFDN